MIKRVALIGGGRIGKFIINRLFKSYSHIKVMVSTRSLESASKLMETFPVRATTNNHEVLNFSDIVFLCIRPDNLKEFLNQIRDKPLEGKTFISLLVLFEPHELEKALGACRVCTFHPTTYFHYTERNFLRSFIIFSKNFSKEDKENLKNFLSGAFGYIQEEKNLNSLKEKIFLYGNFPAYLLEFLDGILSFLSERLGISEEEARDLLGDVLKLNTEDMQLIKDSIATPGGITQRGLESIRKIMEELFYSLEGNTFLKIDKGREKYEDL